MSFFAANYDISEASTKAFFKRLRKFVIRNIQFVYMRRQFTFFTIFICIDYSFSLKTFRSRNVC